LLAFHGSNYYNGPFLKYELFAKDKMNTIASVLAKAKYWATHSAFDQDTRHEVQQLLRNNDTKELTERFYRNLSFGTGGMRGIMGAGTYRINRYNIQKATSAFLSYLEENFPETKELRIAISYDSRHHSREFANAAAEIIASRGGKAFITAEMRPTPLLSFMVRHFSCQGGICITASHNPPVYNGFKVYLSYGGQLVPPHDHAVVDYYSQLDEFTPDISRSYVESLADGAIVEVGEEIDRAYLAEVQSLSLNVQGRENLKIVYTPLHGTGGFLVPAALRNFGFKEVHLPSEQAQPDGDFPTLVSPNPEDPRAFEIALALARKIDADLILATDPDSDRIGVMIPTGKGFYFINGNQLSCLLQNYLLSALQEQGRLPKNSLIVKTIVTTDLLREIAALYDVHCEETLTGFKWIAARVEAYEQGLLQPYRQFICGGEESYGFLAGNFVRDKDAVIAAALTAEMVAVYKSRGMTLLDGLDEIFSRCGVFWEALHSVDLPGMAGAQQMATLMQRLAEQPPREIAGIAVQRIVDYQQGISKEWVEGCLRSGEPTTLPAEAVLQFFLEDGSTISIRPSGTEPKVKIYLAVRDKRRNLRGEALAASKVALQDKLGRFAKSLPDLLKCE
jgi:phosphoglucomutase